MKKFISIGLVFVIIFTLTSCAPKTKSESELKSDLQTYLNSFSEPYVNIEEMKILNRLTDTDARSDVVYVEITVKNEDIKGELSYVMNYHLYDQGWAFEAATRNYQGTWNMKPLRGPKQGNADALVAEKYSKAVFKEKEESIENKKSTFYYIDTNGKTKHTTFSTIYSLEFTFNDEKGLWEAGKIQEVKKEHKWDIAGTWYPVYNQYVPSTGWYDGYVMTISDVVDNKVHTRVSKEGKIYFDEDVTFDNTNGAKFTVKTSDSNWDNIYMVISPNAIGADDLGTRAGCYFERK